MNKALKFKLFFGIIVIAMIVAAVVGITTANDDRAYETYGFSSMTADQLSNDSYMAVPAMLAAIYLAFSETDEDIIYDKLAEVSAGDALEILYLERVGAMVGGGLAEGDQTLHAIELNNLSTQRSRSTFTIDVQWQVIGTVGHATHLHVRGNTYSAKLTVKPVDGAWRMTAFDLTDVDRLDAGTLVPSQ